MNCKRCGSNNINFSTSTIAKSKNRSFTWNLLMICCTGGFWLLWMLVRKKKQKLVKITTATCQNCGNSWNVK